MRSGQVRVLNVHIQSARLSRAQVPAFAGISVRAREKREEGFLSLSRRFLCKGGGGGPPALAGTREYEQSDRNR